MRKTAALLTLLLSVAGAGYGRVTSALTGRVTSSEGAALPQVDVTVTAPSLPGSRSTTTGPTGEYFFDALPPGSYSITFERQGFQAVTRQAELRLGITSRADALTAASEVDESVTMTATMVPVLETPELSTSLTAETVERLPLGRSISERASIGPGVRTSDLFNQLAINGGMPGDNLALLDGLDAGAGAYDMVPEPVVEEAIAETTLITGAISPEFARFTGGVILTITKSGGNDWSGSLRDNIGKDTGKDTSSRRETDSDLRHRPEATLGGRLLTDRLWFFTAGAMNDPRYQARLTAAPAGSHVLDASYASAEDSTLSRSSDIEIWSAHYTGIVGPHGTVEGFAGRSDCSTEAFVYSSRCSIGGTESKQWSARGSYFLSTRSAGSHHLVAGYERFRESTDEGLLLPQRNMRSFFINDEVTLGTAWSLTAGLRHDDDDHRSRVSPRVGVIFDRNGDGRHRVSASWGRYVSWYGVAMDVDELTAGYGHPFAGNGYVRVDVLRRTFDHRAEPWSALQLHGTYVFLGLVTAGGNYTLATASLPADERHRANVWLQFTIPTRIGPFDAAILERYHSASDAGDAVGSTDLTLIYSKPISRANAFVKADLINALDNKAIDRVCTSDCPASVPHYQTRRTLRLAIGARF